MATDFDLGFTPEQFSTLQAEDGAGWRRTLFGDYTLKIVDGEIQPSKNAKKPHNMLKVTFEVVKSYEERTASEVGSQVTNLYGTANSPEFMQKRFKALCEACKVVPGKGGLKFSQLLGKQFDASIVWELSDSGKLDDFGNKKFYVNDRVKAERTVGTPRPKTLNPVADSQKAARYLEQQGGESGGASAGTPDTAPWQANGNGEAAANGGAGAAAPSFFPESEVEPVAHEYRAIYKLGGEESEAAKQALIDAGTDPEGPVDIAHLSDDTRAAYEAKFGNGAPKKPGLKPLGGKNAGTRQPRA